MGYLTHSFSLLDGVISSIVILLPLALRPKNILFLEIAFAIFYLLLYIPILITFLNSYESTLEILYNQSFFVVGFILIFSIPKIRFANVKYVKIQAMDMKVLICVILCFLALLIVQYRHSYRIVSFDDVYDQRSETVADSAFFGYLILWVTYLFGPILLVNGLRKSNIYACFLGIFSIVFIYGIGGSKISLFIPILILGIYFVHRKGYAILPALAYGFSFMILFLLSVSKNFVMLAAIILMRTFGIAGLLTYQYNEFFKKNELTFFSHINFVNFFSHSYPYDRPLGFVVSSSLTNDSNVNANANFFATDGIASLGLLGVIVISVILGLYFAFTKAQTNKENEITFGIMIVPFCFIVLNVGLFTSLLSGGFLFLNLYYLFFKSH